jgi:CheY-like chemotaxis protein
MTTTATQPLASLGQPDVTPRGRVLIVDDDALVARALARILSPPHDVQVVQSGEAAVALIDGGAEFDVVLCDVMMPRMTGIELYARVERSAPAIAGRMVFLTGGAFTPAAREFLQRLPNRCVDKPVGALALRALVADFVRPR